MVRPIVNGIVKHAMNKAENDQAHINSSKGVRKQGQYKF